MNKFKYYFILIITCLSLFSCSKDDNSVEAEPLRDFGEQFATDKAAIEEYLNTYTFVRTDAPGQPEDQDVVITKIPTGGSEPSIMSYLGSSTFPKLIKKNLELHGIVYEIYYLVLREGTGDKPCNVDGVLSSYKGQYLYKSTVNEVTTLTATQFEEVKYPQTFFNLYETITGWSEVFPEFRTGDTPISNTDGTVTYNNFGAGVMFLPSGLGYYSSGQGSIPSYAPLVFSFKLYAINRSDLDNDGIPSYLEDLNGDNYVRNFAAGVDNPDDFDKDGVPDYLDIDDDGDSFTTRSEITVNGVVTPFNLIPDCSGNTTNANRLKKHLDKNCH
jgi:hypothetical protein